LDSARAADLVLAVNELAANSVRFGGSHGTLWLWQSDGELVCEVEDDGQVTQPLAGRRRPAPSAADGRGLWMVNQLCDLVQLRSSPAGTSVRVHMRSVAAASG
jgi:anti-sigma regulatory factor (Ser/Thr protein kinase)